MLKLSCATLVAFLVLGCGDTVHQGDLGPVATPDGLRPCAGQPISPEEAASKGWAFDTPDGKYHGPSASLRYWEPGIGWQPPQHCCGM